MNETLQVTNDPANSGTTSYRFKDKTIAGAAVHAAIYTPTRHFGVSLPPSLVRCTQEARTHTREHRFHGFP